MKKLFISALVLMGSAMGCCAQLLDVVSTRRVDLPEGIMVNKATLSPDGNAVVLSDLASTALHRMDLNSGKFTRITDNGSSLDLAFSPDGSQIVYRKSTVDSRKRRHTSLVSTDLTTGKEIQMIAPTRNFAGFRVTEDGILSSISDSRPTARRIKGNVQVTKAQPVVGIHRGHLTISRNGETINLDPQGKGSYLWPSLSPDGTRIVYYKAASGCFTCNLDGSDVKPLGYLHGAVWIDNNTVVGFQDIDDGTVTTESKIIAKSIDGQVSQTLSDDSLIAFNPTVSKDGKRIAFSTDRGELYILTIK